MKLARIFGIILAITVLLFGLYYMVFPQSENAPAELKQPKEQIENVLPHHPLKNYKQMTNDINSVTNGFRDNYSVFVAQPTVRDDYLIINNKVRRSASMIKVFIMAYIMNQAAHNSLNLNTYVVLEENDKVGGSGIISGWRTGTVISLGELTKLMITESDNTATNILIDYLGMDNINEYIRQNGYDETVLQRKMMDWKAIENGRENYTSVKDLGIFFSKLVVMSCVDAKYDQKMIDILLQQTDMEVFPAVVPDARIAHKTGELDNLYDDGGIVFTPGEPYVIVVMNDGVSREEAISTMKTIFMTVNDDLKTNIVQ